MPNTLEQCNGLRVTLRQALAEIDSHRILCDYDADTGEIFDPYDGETIALRGSDGLYSAARILRWLGY